MRTKLTRQYGSLFIIITTLYSFALCSNLDDARKVLQSYFEAVSKDDTATINATITDEAHGITAIGLRAYYYKRFEESTTKKWTSKYAILDEKEDKTHTKFLVEDPWPTKQKRWFFLIIKDGSWKITAPWEVLCNHYCSIETEHFVVYWSKEGSFVSPNLDITPSLLSLRKLEELYHDISQLLNYEVPYKIQYYVCPSDREPMLFLEGLEGMKEQGSNSVDSKICFAIHPYNAHVVIHAISISAIQKKIPPMPHPLIREGLATAFQWPDARIGHIPSVILVKNMFDNNACPSLDSLIRNYNKLPSQLQYPIAATFVLFIIERYGKEKFLRLWYNQPHDNVVAFVDTLEAIYGKDLCELERLWKEYVLTKTKKLFVPIEYTYNQILTANWIETASDYFIVHHKSYDKPSKDNLHILDSLYTNLCRMIGLEPLRAVDYYKCSDFNEMYFMFGWPNRNYGLASETTIVSLRLPDSYQIIWSLLKRLNCRYKPILESAVSILGCDSLSNLIIADSIVKEAMCKDSLISLAAEHNLISQDECKSTLFLTQWTSFCYYLVRNYGLSNFILCIKNLSDGERLLLKVKSVYKKDFRELEEEWKKHLGYRE